MSRHVKRNYFGRHIRSDARIPSFLGVSPGGALGPFARRGGDRRRGRKHTLRIQPWLANVELQELQLRGDRGPLSAPDQ